MVRQVLKSEIRFTSCTIRCRLCVQAVFDLQLICRMLGAVSATLEAFVDVIQGTQQ